MVQSRLYSNQQPHRSEKPLQIESNLTQFAVFFLLPRGRFRPALTHGTRAVLSTGFSCEARDHGRKAIETNDKDSNEMSRRLMERMDRWSMVFAQRRGTTSGSSLCNW